MRSLPDGHTKPPSRYGSEVHLTMGLAFHVEAMFRLLPSWLPSWIPSMHGAPPPLR